MAREPKTRPTRVSVAAFLNAVEDPEKRKDAKAVDKLMKALVGEKGRMWGSSIVGYGTYTHVYADGKEREWMLTGFSPRKTALTVYIMDGFKKRAALLKKLGPHKTGKACLYLKRLEDIDFEVLSELIEASVEAKRREHA